MRGPWRAFLALVLHLCFFALPLCAVLGLTATAVYIARYSTGAALRAAFAAIVVATLVGMGLRAILRTRVRPIGVPISASEQARIWKLAETAASAAGTDDPDEIRITAEPRAQVREDTALLGLRGRTRYLEIGLPLLGGLTVSELQAVLAHELGRLGTGKPAAVRRIGRSIEHTVAELVGGPMKWLFGGYARLFAACARTVREDVELRAPKVAVKVAGKRVAVTALHKSVAVEIGWRKYAAEYLSMATKVERRPDVLPGFHSFMEHPERKPELAEAAKRSISDANGPYPTVRDRIEVLKRGSERDRERDDHPAVALIREPRSSIPELEDELMIDGLGPRTPWSELAKLAGADQVAHQAGLLSSAVQQSGVGEGPALGAVLAAIHRGEAADLINPVLNPGLDPDRLSEAVEDTLTELLGDATVDALVTTGRAQHELDWGGPSIVRLTGGRPLDPDRLVRPAVADPRQIPGLHRALVDLGVPLNHARPPVDDPEPEIAGLISAVGYASNRYELIVTDRGLLLVPSESSRFRPLLAAAFARVRRKENDYLAELVNTPVDQLREESDVQWVDSRDVATARLDTERSEWTLRLDLYLDEYAVSSLGSAGIKRDEDDVATIELRSTRDSVERGDPYSGLGDLMGARMAGEGPGESTSQRASAESVASASSS